MELRSKSQDNSIQNVQSQATCEQTDNAHIFMHDHMLGNIHKVLP